MGERSLLANLGAADLDGDDGLVHVLACLDERVGAVEALDVDGKAFRVLVAPRIGDKLAEVDIRLVAQADEEAHAIVVLLGGAERGKQVRAGLRDHGNRALDGQVGDEAAVEVQVRAAHSDQIRADERQLVVAAVLRELVLQSAASDLLEGARRDDDDLDLLRHAVLEDRFHDVCRHGQKREVDLVGDVLDRRIGVKPADLLGTGVYRVNLALVSPCLQTVDDLVADLRRVAARAYYGNRFRVQRILKVVDDVLSWMLDDHVTLPPPGLCKNGISGRQLRACSAGSHPSSRTLPNTRSRHRAWQPSA